jgi:uncharacterized surface protein with fasciclin (FAS1) repeats
MEGGKVPPLAQKDEQISKTDMEESFVCQGGRAGYGGRSFSRTHSMMNQSSFLRFLACAVICAFALPSFAAGDERKPHERDLAVRLHQKGFNTLIMAINEAGLKDELSAAGATTLLAPTDNAFRDLPKAELDALLADKAKLKKVILNHLVEGKLSTADLKSFNITTKGGAKLESKTVEGKIKIGAATVVKPDIEASNGVIQGIDKLILP